MMWLRKVTGGVELSLLCFDEQAILQEPIEDLSDMLDVFSLVLGEDEDIVKVDKKQICPAYL